jgi:NTP pyrophosphatase (non-canonical NTP hydrolase)
VSGDTIGAQTPFNFVVVFNNVQAEAYTVNCQNGFWDARNKLIESGMVGAVETVALSCLALVTSEVAEAMEAVRKHDLKTWGDADTKDTLVAELAGTVIRCMDLAERFNLPLAQAIVREIERNSKRGYMHGGKAA